jgi:hypothetical protein
VGVPSPNIESRRSKPTLVVKCPAAAAFIKLITVHIMAKSGVTMQLTRFSSLPCKLGSFMQRLKWYKNEACAKRPATSADCPDNGSILIYDIGGEIADENTYYFTGRLMNNLSPVLSP